MNFIVMEFGEAVFVDRNNGWQIWNETLQSLSMAKMVKVTLGSRVSQTLWARFTKSLNGLQKQLHLFLEMKNIG